MYQTADLTGTAHVPLEPSDLQRHEGHTNAVAPVMNKGNTPSSGRALPAPLRWQHEPSGIQRWRQRSSCGDHHAERAARGLSSAQPGHSSRHRGNLCKRSSSLRPPGSQDTTQHPRLNAPTALSSLKLGMEAAFFDYNQNPDPCLAEIHFCFLLPSSVL